MHDKPDALVTGANQAIGLDIVRGLVAHRFIADVAALAQVALYSGYCVNVPSMNPLRFRPVFALPSPCGDGMRSLARHLARLSCAR